MNRQQVMVQLDQLKADMKPKDYAEVKRKITKGSNLEDIAFSLRFHKFRVQNRGKA